MLSPGFHSTPNYFFTSRVLRPLPPPSSPTTSEIKLFHLAKMDRLLSHPSMPRCFGGEAVLNTTHSPPAQTAFNRPDSSIPPCSRLISPSPSPFLFGKNTFPSVPFPQELHDILNKPHRKRERGVGLGRHPPKHPLPSPSSATTRNEYRRRPPPFLHPQKWVRGGGGLREVEGKARQGKRNPVNESPSPRDGGRWRLHRCATQLKER